MEPSGVTERAVAAARALTLAHGWDGVRMGRIAEEIGVSRPTLYKQVGDKQAMAAVLAAAESRTFVAGVVAELSDGAGPPAEVLRAAVGHCLEAVRASPVLHALLGPAGSDLLPALTTRAGPTLELASAALLPAMAALFPRADETTVVETIDTVVRLSLSHVLQPSSPARPDPAETITRVALALLDRSP